MILTAKLPHEWRIASPSFSQNLPPILTATAESPIGAAWEARGNILTKLAGRDPKSGRTE
jgi:hypothetical protein